MFRLGVATRILGKAGLRARDGRTAEHAPHLSISLLHVRDVLMYLAEHDIRCYRLANDLAPFLTDPRRPAFAHQIEESADLLAETGALARSLGIRLTMHAPLHIALATPDEEVAARGIAELNALARLLDALGTGPESMIVLHVGGAYGDAAAALFRFARRFESLPKQTRRRIAIEHDDTSYALADVLRLHQQTGAVVVFDALHHLLHNPACIPAAEAVGLALATWPCGVRPKVHFSTPRTEAHLLPARNGQERQVLAPLAGQHSDYVNPFEFVAFANALRGLPECDIVVEAKAADLAVLRLRADLTRYAPELAARVR